MQTFIELVKSLFVDLEADNMMVPWVYLCFCDSASLDAKAAELTQAKKTQQSANSSKTNIMQGGTSTNINKSAAMGAQGVTSNQMLSVINDSGVDLDLEFGYMTDEDSIFQSFMQETEKAIPRLDRQVKVGTDPSSVQKEIKDVLKRVSLLRG